MKKIDGKMFFDYLTEETMDQVIEIYISHYNGYEDGEWTYETDYRRIHQMLTIEDSLCLIVKKEQEIIGLVYGYLEQYDDIKAYNLKEIVLRPELQNKGIGQKIMLALEDVVREHGGSSIRLDAVNDGMHDHFYKKLGYQDTTNLISKSKWLD